MLLSLGGRVKPDHGEREMLSDRVKLDHGEDMPTIPAALIPAAISPLSRGRNP
jgi:hypothetical protein